ncbi:helix-turn-helix domain-containing protein [Cohnella cellulosilytica]|uniref:Helix-turn-helix domain-containing protein n=1 Tax=Cohnella cellulosilytica TaxID=986710 RepID=A0ABW2FFL7_9BACL
MADYYYEFREARVLALGSPERQTTVTTDIPALLLVTEGEGSLQLGESICNLHFGCLALLAPGSRAQLRCPEGSGLHAYLLQFDVYRLIEQGRNHLLHRRSHEILPQPGLLADRSGPRLFELFKLLHEAGQSPNKTSLSLTLQRLLLETVELSFARSEDGVPSGEDPIRKAIRHIHEHYGSELNRTMLAELTGYHPHYFSRKFLQETGLRVSDYIATVRMRKAKEMLLTTFVPIRDIAARTGYGDALYFSRKFRQLTGAYPTEYREAPKRVAVYHFLGTMLQLGIKPIACESHMLRYSDQLHDKTGGIESFESWDLDRLRTLKPELIVASNYMHAELRGQLEEIAPVLIKSEEVRPLDNLKVFGSLLRREREADAALTRMLALATQLRERLSRWQGETVTTAVYELSAGHLYVMGRYDRCCYAAYEMLGLRPPASVANRLADSGTYLRLEPDQLAEYAADHMIVCMYEEEGMELTEGLTESEPWNSLPAVRRRQVYKVPIGLYWYNDGLSLERQMLMIADLLLHGK